MHLSPLHAIGLLATILLIIAIGLWSGRRVKSAEDFSSGGGKAGAWSLPCAPFRHSRGIL